MSLFWMHSKTLIYVGNFHCRISLRYFQLGKNNFVCSNLISKILVVLENSVIVFYCEAL